VLNLAAKTCGGAAPGSGGAALAAALAPPSAVADAAVAVSAAVAGQGGEAAAAAAAAALPSATEPTLAPQALLDALGHDALEALGALRATLAESLEIAKRIHATQPRGTQAVVRAVKPLVRTLARLPAGQ